MSRMKNPYLLGAVLLLVLGCLCLHAAPGLGVLVILLALIVTLFGMRREQRGRATEEDLGLIRLHD